MGLAIHGLSGQLDKSTNPGQIVVHENMPVWERCQSTFGAVTVQFKMTVTVVQTNCSKIQWVGRWWVCVHAHLQLAVWLPCLDRWTKLCRCGQGPRWPAALGGQCCPPLFVHHFLSTTGLDNFFLAGLDSRVVWTNPSTGQMLAKWLHTINRVCARTQFL